MKIPCPPPFKCTGIWSAFAAAMLLGTFAPAAFGQFTLVEDFNGLTVGPIDGQNGWTASSATIDVVDSPAPFSVSNKALNNGDESTQAYKTFGSIADGTVGTVFFQLYVTDFASATSFGLADATIGTAPDFNSFRSQMAFTAPGAFTVRNGGSSATIDQSLTLNTLYNVWIVSNNASNQSQFYIQGGSFVSQTQLTSGATTSFAYRSNEPSDAAVTNFLVAKSSTASTDDSVYFDNIYFSSGANLINPIPEPSAYAFLGAGLLLLCLGRRCFSRRVQAVASRS